MTVITRNVSMDEMLWEAIDSFAEYTRRSKSEVLRLAVEQFLYHNYPQEPIYMHKKFHPNQEKSKP